MMLSIVSPCFNPGPLLASTIDSIRRQSWRPVEHVICDAGSSDGTVARLAAWGAQPGLVWRSEPDGGIYDGLNKALALASGEVIGWLNCDDLYPDGVLAEAMAAFAADSSLEVVCGDAELFQGDNGDIQTIRVDQHYRGDRLVANGENLRVTHLNACFFRRRLLERVGAFDTRYRVVADRDYLFRLMALAPRSRHLDRVTCRYRAHGGSRTMAHLKPDGSGTMIPPGDPIWSELASLSERYLRRRNTDTQIRQWCRNMLSAVTSTDALAAMDRRDYSIMLAQAARAMRHDPRWPLLVWRRWRRQLKPPAGSRAD
jgi:glycosyltransferase involved in cell wall biosynthesis